MDLNSREYHEFLELTGRIGSTDIYYDVMESLIIQHFKGTPELQKLTFVENIFQDTPLHFSVKTGNKNSVQQLLENGADVKAKNVCGFSPLHFATSVYVAELLLAKGADIEDKCLRDFTPLFMAVKNDCKDVVALLLERGANIEAKNELGLTPLSAAVKARNELLLTFPNTPDNYGFKSIVELLLENGADVNSRSKDGLSPLNLAREDIECGKVLVKYALLQNPDAKSVKEILENTELSEFWDICKNELNILLGNSSLPLYRFLQENNEDILVSYLLNKATGLHEKFENGQNFKIYTNMVASQIEKAKKRECLLYESKFVMEECNLKILPTEIKFKIGKLLTSPELEIFVKASAYVLKRKLDCSHNKSVETCMKKLKH